jgi:hypothetical protein
MNNLRIEDCVALRRAARQHIRMNEKVYYLLKSEKKFE